MSFQRHRLLAVALTVVIATTTGAAAVESAGQRRTSPTRVAPTFPSRVLDGHQPRYTGEPISLSLKNADVKDVLATFAKLTGLNVVLYPGVSGSVTLELRDVPWDQALDLILTVNGLRWELEGNVLLISPRRTGR